jgi:hypothetical protein
VLGMCLLGDEVLQELIHVGSYVCLQAGQQSVGLLNSGACAYKAHSALRLLDGRPVGGHLGAATRICSPHVL